MNHDISICNLIDTQRMHNGVVIIFVRGREEGPNTVRVREMSGKEKMEGPANKGVRFVTGLAV
jgi:hypothetical protein